MGEFTAELVASGFLEGEPRGLSVGASVMMKNKHSDSLEHGKGMGS